MVLKVQGLCVYFGTGYQLFAECTTGMLVDMLAGHVNSEHNTKTTNDEHCFGLNPFTSLAYRYAEM